MPGRGERHSGRLHPQEHAGLIDPIVRLQSARDVSSIAARSPMPALFTRVSSPPSSRDRRRDHSLRRHIEMDVERAGAVRVDFPGYLGPGLVLDIGDQDGGTFAREPSRSSAPTPLADPVTRATRPASLSTAPFPQFRASSYSHQQLSVPLPDAPDEED